MVLGEDHLGLVAPHGQRLVQVLRPGQRLADLGAAQRIGVVQRVGRVLGGLDRLLLLDVPEHLGRRLGARRHQELVGQPVDRLLLAGLGDDVGRRDQRHRAGRGRGAEAGADLPLRVGRQQVAVHVARAAAHGVAGEDVLGDRGLEEALGRVDLHRARRRRPPGRRRRGRRHSGRRGCGCRSPPSPACRRGARGRGRARPCAVSAETSGSTMVMPSAPSMIVMFERSWLRTW